MVHCRATSASASASRASIEMILVWIVSFPTARCFTKSAMPPDALNTCLSGLPSRSSISWISTPLVRKACSWRRSASIRLSNSTPSTKISGSGQNVMIVPVLRVALPLVSLVVALPRTKVCVHEAPSRITWTTSFSERAFTTDTPTPWSPPEIR